MRTGLLLTVILAATSVQLSQKPNERQHAQVNGTVRDVLGAAIVGASVELTSRASHYSLRTTYSGAYSGELTPGVYNLVAIKFPFCDGHRAAFSIAANQKVELDFVLPLNVVPQAVEGSVQIPPSKGCYKQEELSAVGKDELRPLVLFGTREAKAGSIFYSDLKIRSPGYQGYGHIDYQYPVVFTYDLLTLKADSLVYKLRERSVTGTGNVILQNGTQTRRGPRITIRFNNGVLDPTTVAR